MLNKSYLRSDHMKKLLLATLFITNIFAQNILIKCEMPGITTENQFSLLGELYIEGQNFDANLQISLRDRGPESEVNELDLQRTGKIYKYPAGQIAKKEIVLIQSVDKEDLFQFINLVGNHPRPLSSIIRLKDGMTYRAKCSVTTCEKKCLN